MTVGVKMKIFTNAGELEVQTKEELEAVIRKSALNPYDDIWMGGEEKYPCLAILVNGMRACVHFFLNDTGDMWQSAGDQEEDVLFAVHGELPNWMPGSCVVSLDEAIRCAGQFLETGERPDCIDWNEL